MSSLAAEHGRRRAEPPTRATTTTRVTCGIVIPRPFCATGPADFVKLEGPLDFSLTVETDQFGPMTVLVTEKAAQRLLGDPRQSLTWRFAAGDFDHFVRRKPTSPYPFG